MEAVILSLKAFPASGPAAPPDPAALPAPAVRPAREFRPAAAPALPAARR